MNYSNFKCYNIKGDRFAIFGKHLDNNKLQLFILKCSKKDHFNKNTAKSVYQLYQDFPNTFENLTVEEVKYHPTILNLEVGTDSPKYVFDKYCRENFFRKVERIAKFAITELVSNKSRKTVKTNYLIKF